MLYQLMDVEGEEEEREEREKGWFWSCKRLPRAMISVESAERCRWQQRVAVTICLNGRHAQSQAQRWRPTAKMPLAAISRHLELLTVGEHVMED